MLKKRGKPEEVIDESMASIEDGAGDKSCATDNRQEEPLVSSKTGTGTKVAGGKSGTSNQVSFYPGQQLTYDDELQHADIAASSQNNTNINSQQ